MKRSFWWGVEVYSFQRGSQFVKPLLFLGFLLVTSLLFGCTRRSDSPDSPIVVGMDLNYPPFEMSEAGAPAGFSVELVEALSKAMGRKVEIKNIPFDGLIPALKVGEIDAICSSMTITDARARVVDFSVPYIRLGLSFAYRKNSGFSGKKADLYAPNLKVAVRQGGTPDLWAIDHLKAANIHRYPTAIEALSDLLANRVAVFIYDPISLIQIAHRHSEIDVNVLPLKDSVKPWAIAVRKNDPLKAAVNAGITHLQADGTLHAITAKYLKTYQDFFKKAGVPFFVLDTQDSTTIKPAVSATTPQ